ncbi:hypothetical protein LC55x_0715 [Lysobacter capsici]|nr:hypothetical protein LC55x_0715 [Lysobacter capsici]
MSRDLGFGIWDLGFGKREAGSGKREFAIVVRRKMAAADRSRRQPLSLWRSHSDDASQSDGTTNPCIFCSA